MQGRETSFLGKGNPSCFWGITVPYWGETGSICKTGSDFMKTLYFGGAILSMEEQKPVESLLVEEGRILALGNLDEVVPLAPRGHPGQLGRPGAAPRLCGRPQPHHRPGPDLGPVPTGRVQQPSGSVPAAESLSGAGGRSPQGSGSLALGTTKTSCKRGCHPTAAVLDAFLPDCPAMVTHASGHMGGSQLPGDAKAGHHGKHP